MGQKLKTDISFSRAQRSVMTQGDNRGVVLQKLLVGLKGFTGPLPLPNLTFCLDFRSSVQS